MKTTGKCGSRLMKPITGRVVALTSFVHMKHTSTEPSNMSGNTSAPMPCPRIKHGATWRQLQRTRVRHILKKLSESQSSVGAPESEGGSEAQPRYHYPSRQGNCFGKSRDLICGEMSAASRTTSAATGDRFCVAPYSDFITETHSTGSHGTITTEVLPKRNTLGSCTEPMHY